MMYVRRKHNGEADQYQTDGALSFHSIKETLTEQHS